MDAVFLSRLQFAIATYFHFIFVPLTIGLSLMIAIFQTTWYRTDDADYLRLTKFFGKLFLINFAIGIVTGITLEFQFGTNWSRYSMFVGDIFGSLLAIEASVAFFLESTFIAVWFFGWNRLPKKLHLVSIWLVAIGSLISAYWILVANSWMQNPVGYVIRDGRAELTDFFAVIFQPYALLKIAHTVGATYLTAGFFVLGISAWHLLRGSHAQVFRKAFAFASVWTLVFSVFLVAQGHMNAGSLADKQPIKLAAMEAHWETQAGAPMHLLQWPDVDNEKNAIEAFTIPKLLSFLAWHDGNAEVQGLKSVPLADRPPVLPTFLSFRAMVGLAFLFILLSAWAFINRNNPGQNPLMLKILPWAIPLPYIANELGWTVAEVGRQPWIVYNLMRTSDAASPISSGQVAISSVAFILVYTLLGAANIYLLAKYARKGPEDVHEIGY
ncbi:MAG: cytochrome ubiquinol oxidase subunit I [Syntrophorhabdaceae bacterium]|nr:cytochrome ubiquinol oxidase subunit I [Syntrophorhabdaceae bacterium]